MRVIEQRARAEQQTITHLAWLTEAMARTKRLPKLEKLLREMDGPSTKKKAQTAEQMMASLRARFAGKG